LSQCGCSNASLHGLPMVLLFVGLVLSLIYGDTGHVIRRQPSKKATRFELDKFDFMESHENDVHLKGPWQLACGYARVPQKAEAAHFSGTLLTLIFSWIPKPCAAPLLLRWYGSYFQHIVTASVSPPPERSPVPHVRCGTRGTSSLHLCYAKVLRRHKGFSNYLFLDSDVLMRPHRVLSFPLDRPWVPALGGYTPRTFYHLRLDGGNMSFQLAAESKASLRQWHGVENLMQWWQRVAALPVKQLYMKGAGGAWSPHPAVLGVANIPAAMTKYYVAMAESMSNVSSMFAHAMIHDLWEMLPSMSKKTFMVDEASTFWAEGIPELKLYQERTEAFVHPVKLSGTQRQRLFDQYFVQHKDEF